MCGLPQHGVLGPQHYGAAGAVIVAAFNSPLQDDFLGVVLFLVFAVRVKKHWGAVLSSRKAKIFWGAAVLSSP